MFKKIFSARGMGQVISVFAALVVMVIVFGVINPLFFSSSNITNLLRQVAPILIIGIGQSFVLISAGIDLSIGSVAGMSCMLCATLMTRLNMNPIFAVIITLACCLVIGTVNGLLISVAKLPAFIATLGTMIIARGVAQLVNGNMNTDGIPSDAFKEFFYYGSFLGIYTPIWIAAVLFVIFAFVLAKTSTGRHVYALGSNYEAAKLSGVNVAAAETKVYIISAFLAGVVGLILTAQSGMGSMDAGTGYELNAVAASVIGGVSTMGGQGMLFGTVIGAFIWGVLNNGLQFAGAPLALRNIVIGIVVIISVLIDRVVRGNRKLNSNVLKGLKLKKNG
ncbi:MAG: ABC transporter permease [Oscillospiraceae bacterium]|nr:ABC transporter permease [Oscillospiraceae bacterium]